jgi:1-acyl-sn-glycerol-3-phosphate acyltransferase
MQRAKPGVAYLVDATRVPVLPVGLVGTTDDYWQRARRGEKPMLEMRIGKPISLPPIDMKNGAARREARQQNTDLVMRHMAGLLPEEYRGVYAESVIAPS